MQKEKEVRHEEEQHTQRAEMLLLMEIFLMRKARVPLPMDSALMQKVIALLLLVMNSTFKAEIIAKIPKVNTLILLVMALLLFLLTPILSTGKVMLGSKAMFILVQLLALIKTMVVKN
jgi:hypothetical protein